MKRTTKRPRQPKPPPPDTAARIATLSRILEDRVLAVDIDARDLRARVLAILLDLRGVAIVEHDLGEED
jgi:hypothetical protein